MRIDNRTELYAVIGSPIRHSMSPLMHNTAFDSAGINAAYVAFDVKDLSAAMAGMRSLGIKGLSVTIPHKVSIMAELDQIDKSAQDIGAVNTVVNRDGQLLGFNTDAGGAVRAVTEKTDIFGKEVGIIGAGGASRAIAFGIGGEGGRVTIFNRTLSKARELARMVDGNALPLSALGTVQVDILINTTPIGMTPYEDGCPVDSEVLKPGMVVMDAVYNPLETKLIRTASSKGCDVVSGLMMFIYQGAAQFELWTGRKAPLSAMRQAVVECLSRKR
jgi:shikimate dehydrogenase